MMRKIEKIQVVLLVVLKISKFREIWPNPLGNAMSNSSVVVQVRTVNSCVRYGKVPVRVTCVLVPVVLQ
jgi:hypothetical protein